MPAENRLEYAIQATASVWEPLEQVHYVVSGDVDFVSFGMAPWDAGGMHGDSCQLRETLWTMMLQWLTWLLCRPVIMNGLDRTMRLNTENGLDWSMMTNTESHRLAVNPGEWYASEMIRVIRTDLRQTNGFTEMMGAMCDYTTVEIFTQIDSAVADCGAGELDDFIFRRTSFPPHELSGHDGNYTEDYSTVWGFPHIDSAAVDYGAGAVELDDLIFRRTSFPPDELSAGRDADYIWLDLWTDLAVCARSVTGSLLFGHPHGLVYSCFCLTFLCLRCLESMDVSQDRHCRTTVVRITPDICCPRRTWCIEEYVGRSSIIVVLIIWYCFGVFRVRAMESDRLPDREQAGPSYAASGPLPGTFLGPALDIRSESLYELAPDIPDVMGLRALRPDAADVKVMSVRDSRCIRVVTLDDHVAYGYHKILLHDM